MGLKPFFIAIAVLYYLHERAKKHSPVLTILGGMRDMLLPVPDMDALKCFLGRHEAVWNCGCGAAKCVRCGQYEATWKV